MHVRQIWMRPHYQFIPFLAAGAAVLAFPRLRKLGPLTPGRPARAAALLGAAWAALAVAELLYSSWLGAVAALAALGAALYAVGGGRLFRALLPAWLLLWLAVPPPFELDRQLVLGLQSLTARWASAVLDSLGLYHVMAGNVVEVGGRRLFVEEACSGVNSLFSVLACTLFFVLLTRRPPVRAALLLAAAAVWVLAANTVRVAGIAYFLARCGVDLTEGWRHEALGFGLFVAVLGLVWSTDRLLLFLTAPSAPAPPAPAGAPPAAAPDAPGRPAAPAWGGDGGCAALYLLLLPPLTLHCMGRDGRPMGRAALDRRPRRRCGHDGLGRRLAAGPLRTVAARRLRPGRAPPGKRASASGSKTWTYQAGGNTAALSLDYTFPGWHDLTRCYSGLGWAVDEQAVRPGVGPADGSVAVKLTKPGYRSGYLLFCQFNQDGAPLPPRLGAAYLSLYRQEAALRRWLHALGAGVEPTPPDPPGAVYQLQLFVESYTPLGAAEPGRGGGALPFKACLRSGAGGAPKGVGRRPCVSARRGRVPV